MLKRSTILWDQLIFTQRCLQRPTKFAKIQPFTMIEKNPKQFLIFFKRTCTSEFPPTRKETLFSKIFGKYLLLTNVLTSGVLMVFGDLGSQSIEKHRKKLNGQSDSDEGIDYHRMGRMFIVGALQGPLNHFVYNWMDRIMPVPNFKNICRKLFIDQVFMSPACVCLFFYGACFLERKSFKETNDELRSKIGRILMTDWMVWPGVQYLNFRYLPTKFRVVFVNAATALYNVFLSYMKHDYENPAINDMKDNMKI